MPSHFPRAKGPSEMPKQKPLNEVELGLMAILADDNEPVYLVDITTNLAGLPKTLSGQWFDAKLLDPTQTAAHNEAKKAVLKAVRRLFNLGWLDIGSEGQFDEGFKARHDRIWMAMQKEEYWRERPTGVEQQATVIEYHDTWRNVPDFAAAKRQLDAPMDRVGLTQEGRDALGDLPTHAQE